MGWTKGSEWRLGWAGAFIMFPPKFMPESKGRLVTLILGGVPGQW